jgi:uncharacterized protein (DUF1800 family)
LRSCNPRGILPVLRRKERKTLPAPETLGSRVALHLLSRAGYGPRPGEIARVLEQGPTRWIEDQLEPAPDPELESRLDAYPTLAYPTSRVLALVAADPRAAAVVVEELVNGKIVRAVHAKNQLQEVLADFWFNHFNVFVNDGFDRYAVTSYDRDAIRPHVLGRFRALLGAASLHPAMLYYLDNYLNAVPRRVSGRLVGGINENQGRELLELHTVGVDAGYTQVDVVEASRCLTGHGIDSLTSGGNYQFRPASHDGEAKQVFGLPIAAGGGAGDVEALLDHLAAHPATARFVSRRLAERFVSDTPPPGLVERLASVFLATGGDIAAVVRALFGSAEFWAEAFATRKARTPFEFAAGALRAIGAEVQNPRAIRQALSDMGQPLFACNPPTGYTNRGEEWLNPSSHLYRMNFALDLAAGALAGVASDARAFVRNAGGDPDDPRSAAAAANREAFGGTLSAVSLAAAAAVSPGGSVPVAARVVGLLLAGPDAQVR